jgi:hypothetical protein
MIKEKEKAMARAKEKEKAKARTMAKEESLTAKVIKVTTAPFRAIVVFVGNGGIRKQIATASHRTAMRWMWVYFRISSQQVSKRQALSLLQQLLQMCRMLHGRVWGLQHHIELG